MLNILYKNKINIAIVTVLICAFVVMILSPATVKAAGSDDVVVTDTEISFGDYTIPRALDSNLPLYGQYGTWYGSSYSPYLVEGDNALYFYIPSRNIVVFLNCYIVGFNVDGFSWLNGNYGAFCFCIYDLINNSVYTMYDNYSFNTVDLVSHGWRPIYSTYNGSGSVTTKSNYTFDSSSAYVYNYFEGVNFLTDIQILYAKYIIPGFYNPISSDYELPDIILSYQYLFFRENEGYVFIDSSADLSSYEDSFTNYNGSAYIPYLYLKYSEAFNKLVYYSIDGKTWTLVNPNNVYGQTYQVGVSQVSTILGITSNAINWNYYRGNNIPEDLILTTFTSGESIGQTIQYDSGSGEYTSHNSLIMGDSSSLSRHESILYCILDYTNLYQLETLLSIMNLSFYYDSLYFGSCSSGESGDSITGDSHYFISLVPLSVDDNIYLFERDELNWFTHDDNSIYFEWSTKSYPYHVTSVTSYPTLAFRLNNIVHNISILDDNLQTGFTNLSSQLESVFNNITLSNGYLYNISKKLDDLIDLQLAGSGNNDFIVYIDQVEDYLNDIFDYQDTDPIVSTSSTLPGAWEPDTDKFSIQTLGEGLQTFIFQNYSQLQDIKFTLAQIEENTQKDNDIPEFATLPLIVTEFIQGFTTLNTMLNGVVATFRSGGMGLYGFSTLAQETYELLPDQLQGYILLVPTFSVCTAMMFGAKRFFAS